MVDELLTISEAAKFLGVTEKTLRVWEKKGKIIPCERTEGGHRRYFASEIRKMVGEPKEIIEEYGELVEHDRKNSEDIAKKKLKLMQEKGYVSEEETLDNRNLANILNNYLNNSHVDSILFEQTCQEDHDYNLKLIKLAWSKLLTKDLISMHVMSKPTDLFFYIRGKEKIIDSDVVAARTRRYNFNEILKPGRYGLSVEDTLELNSNNIVKDIDEEIIMDLANNSVKVDYWWTQKVQLEDFVGVAGVVTNEVGLKILGKNINNLPNKLTHIEGSLYYHPNVNKFLLIKKGESIMQSAYFYCPYMLYVYTKTGEETHAMLRYGKKMTAYAKDYYTHVDF